MEKKSTLILAGLLLLGFLVYVPSLKNEFVAWDDDWFVTENPFVNELSAERISDSFTEFYNGQYSPVTAFVMALEFKLGHGTPAIFHWVSLLLHLLNAVLVYRILLTIFKKSIPVLLITAVFILHPMQVESVSWISAQKLLISTSFLLLSLWFYQKYLHKQLKFLYLAFTFLFFVLSFFAKEQGLVIAVLIIAFDYLHGRQLWSKRVILEKIPFLLAALAMGLVTIASARSGEFFTENTDKPGLVGQFAYSSYSYMLYLYKILLPYYLSAFYPYPNEASVSQVPAWAFAFIPLVLGLIYYLIKNWKRQNQIVFGILFFSFSIFPFLQVMPLRDFIIADRYVYLASIGLWISLLALTEKFRSKTKTQVPAWALLIGLSLIFSLSSFQRTKVWSNSLALFEDVVEKYPESSVGLNNRGLAYDRAGKYKEAIADYEKSIRLNPTSLFAYNNLATVYNKLNRPEEAIRYLDMAIESSPTFGKALFNRADILNKLGRYEEALADYNQFLGLRPDDPKALISRGITLFRLKNTEAALADLNRSLQLAPSESALLNRGVIYLNIKEYEKAIQDFTATLKMNPSFSYAYFNRGLSYIMSGNTEAGCKDLQQAHSLGFPQAAEVLQKYCGVRP